MDCKGKHLLENWKFFRSSYDDYEVATGLDKKDNKVHLATLRTVMGKDCLSIFNLLPLTEDQRSSVKTCLDSLEEHFKPKVNVVYERYLFNSAVQNPGEKIDDFVHRLRELSKSCDYGMLCDDLVHDRMVLGMTDNDLRLRMFREKAISRQFQWHENQKF